MKRAVLMSKKLYVLDIVDMEDDIENIEQFANEGNPVIVFESIEDIEELHDYFMVWHDEDTVINVEPE